MIPLPGAPSSSWKMFAHRLRSNLDAVDWRVCIAFWLFGLINNILYVILLTAALDLVGPSIPKGLVLLADVMPGFAVKLTAPYYIHHVPYSLRILLFAFLSAAGMLLVALSPTSPNPGGITIKIAGIVLASLSSGGGELSFVGLTHFYGPVSLAAWGSGTGGAGLVGAGAYAIATTRLGLSVRSTLLASALLPLVMLFTFFALLPMGPLKMAKRRKPVVDIDPSTSPFPHDDEDHDSTIETANLLPQSHPSSSPSRNHLLTTLSTNIHRSRALLLPYMLPLFLVYVAEYTINQGVAPTLLFPLSTTPIFSSYRAFYPTYATLYQLGVFISRSSLPFLRIRTLYTPAILQVLNLLALAAHAMFPFLPNVWFVFVVIFWEGLLGGLVYVSTFAAIREEVPEEDREFSLGATTVSDSAGICLAGFLSMAIEKGLCRWQVGHGRDWCERL